MNYLDSRGRRQTLNPHQATYLADAWRQFDQGWGGHYSTLTVRLLEERGLITLARNADPRRPRWTVTGLTKLGEQVLTAWRDHRRR